MTERATRSEDSIGLRRRIRYRFDNLLARGTWAVLLWLGALTFAAVLVSSALLAVFGQTFSGSEDGAWIEDFWQSLLRLLDTGTMAGDVGWGRRVLALLVTIIGILIAGTLIGLIANGVEQRVDEMRRGRSTVVESGHVVILGASERLPAVAEQVALAGRADGLDTIVVLAPRDSDDPVGDLRTGAPSLHGVRLVVRRGDSTKLADLRMVALTQARAVIVLNDGSGDGHVVNSVLAAGVELGGFGRIPVVAEVESTDTALRLVLACGSGVHPLVGAQAIGRIAAFVLREPGLNQVLGELLDLGGTDIRVTDPGDLVGQPFSAAVLEVDNARVIGVVRPDGTVAINPEPDTRITAHDQLALLADHDKPLTRRPAPTRLAVDRAAGGELLAPPRVERVLMIGWSELGAHFLDRLAVSAAPGSSVELVIDRQSLDPEDLPAAVKDSLELTITEDPAAVWNLTQRTPLSELTSVALLASHDGGAEEADSRTLLDLMMLRGHLEPLADVSPRVFVELRDPESADLAPVTTRDDFVVSDTIVSRLLGQLALQPERRAVLLGVDGTQGVSIHLVGAGDLGLDGQVRFAEVVEHAYTRGLLAIGVRRSNGDLAMGLLTTEVVALTDDDRIVVIG